MSVIKNENGETHRFDIFLCMKMVKNSSWKFSAVTMMVKYGSKLSVCKAACGTLFKDIDLEKCKDKCPSCNELITETRPEECACIQNPHIGPA